MSSPAEAQDADLGEGIAPKDAARVRRGRVLLATGIPPIVTGSLAMAWSRPAQNDHCYSSDDTMRPTLLMGVTFAAAGVGLTSGGIVSLVRASRAARRAPKSKPARVRLALAGTGSAMLSSLLLLLVGVNDAVGCYSS